MFTSTLSTDSSRGKSASHISALLQEKFVKAIPDLARISEWPHAHLLSGRYAHSLLGEESHDRLEYPGR